MKPHPRIRKTIKWGGAAVTVLLVVVWIGSLRWGVEGPLTSEWYLSLHSGHLVIMYERLVGWCGTRPPPWNFYQQEGPQSAWERWLPRVWGPATDFFINVPLWLPNTLAIFPTAAAWLLDIRAHRRGGLTLCPKCNYDRAGIAVGAKCPECGSAGLPA